MSLLRRFAGGKRLTIQMISADPSKSGLAGFSNAYMVVDNTGLVTYTRTFFGDGTFRWMTPANAAEENLYEIRFIRTGGDSGVNLSGVANNTWLNLGTTRTAYLAPSGIDDTKIVTANVQIRLASSGVILAYAENTWTNVEIAGGGGGGGGGGTIEEQPQN